MTPVEYEEALISGCPDMGAWDYLRELGEDSGDEPG